MRPQIHACSPLVVLLGTAFGLPAAVVLLFTGFILGGCVATIEERPPRVVYVAGPPPPPLSEGRGAPAAPGMLWVEGYWHWNGVTYVWIPGHWESPPPGYVWSAPSYTMVEGKYVYRAGHWKVGAHASPR